MNPEWDSNTAYGTLDIFCVYTPPYIHHVYVSIDIAVVSKSNTQQVITFKTRAHTKTYIYLIGAKDIFLF